MVEGIVKWFNSTKGYGFVEPKDGTNDVFVHISVVEQAGLNSLKEGQKVHYETATNKGKVAVSTIQLAEETA